MAKVEKNLSRFFLYLRKTQGGPSDLEYTRPKSFVKCITEYALK